MLWLTSFNCIHPFIAIWECLETIRVLNSPIIQIWGQFLVISSRFFGKLYDLMNSKHPKTPGIMLWHTIFNHVHPIIATWEYFETTRVLNRLTIQFWGSISRSFGPFLANSIALDDSKDPIIGGMMLWYANLNYLQPFTAIMDCLEQKNCHLSSISDFQSYFQAQISTLQFFGWQFAKNA